MGMEGLEMLWARVSRWVRIGEIVVRDGGYDVRRVRVRREVWAVRDVRGLGEGGSWVERRWAVQWWRREV